MSHFARIPARPHVGLQLPKSEEKIEKLQNEEKLWSVPPGGPHGDDAPDRDQGHAVSVVAYDSHVLTIVTWGELKQMTWSFWDTYGDEAYAILSPDWFNQKKAPNGFDLETLEQDLNLLETKRKK